MDRRSPAGIWASPRCKNERAGDWRAVGYTGGRLQRSWKNLHSQLRTGGQPAGYGDSRAGAGLRKLVLLREREDRRAAVAGRRAPAGTPWV